MFSLCCRALQHSNASTTTAGASFPHSLQRPYVSASTQAPPTALVAPPTGGPPPSVVAMPSVQSSGPTKFDLLADFGSDPFSPTTRSTAISSKQFVSCAVSHVFKYWRKNFCSFSAWRFTTHISYGLSQCNSTVFGGMEPFGAFRLLLYLIVRQGFVVFQVDRNTETSFHHN